MRLANLSKLVCNLQLMVLGIALQLSSAVHAQLTVLSQGNATRQWQTAQLLQIETQLADRAIVGDLRRELESQQEWLKAYHAGTLTAQPRSADERQKTVSLVEPMLDPSGQASKLRELLLGPQANPSPRDTEFFKLALQAAPDDIGLRQLHLHWLDQPQYREDYSSEIAEAAVSLLSLLQDLKLKPQDKRNALAFTLYRQARALGYRQDPDVLAKQPLTEAELKVVQEQLVGSYQQLMDLVGPGHPEFVLLEIRMLRRDHWFGRALSLLEQHAQAIGPRWYLEKRRDLLRDLGWQPAAEEAHKIFAAEFPAEAGKK